MSGPPTGPAGLPAGSRTGSVAPTQGWGIALAPTVRAIAARPYLWATAASTVLRLARPRWWARRPFLPVPDEAYWQFRLVTAFGGPERSGTVAPGGAAVGEGARLSGDEAIAYLRWCRRMPPARG